MKNRGVLLIATLGLLLSSCQTTSPNATSTSSEGSSVISEGESVPSITSETSEVSVAMKNIVTTIDGKEVDIEWYDNESVRALKEYIAENEEITINTHEYGDFEQVGPLGTTLPTNNEQISTICGDIVLYQGSNICFYFRTNSWSFTRLGRISNMSESDIIAMLDKSNATVVMTLE